MATFFCSKGGLCVELQLYCLWKNTDGATSQFSALGKFVIYFDDLHSQPPLILLGSMLPLGTVINNGNRTEWSPIWSVIIQVINKIRRPCSGSPFCLIGMSMITDRIGWHEVLLPINYNYNKICEYNRLFWIKTQEIPRVFLLAGKKCSLTHSPLNRP